MAWVAHTLPDELSLRIFGCLTARELAQAALVSRTFLQLTRDESIWRGVAVHRWGAGVEQLGITEWRAYCRERTAFERLRETAVDRDDPGTVFIFAPVNVAFSSASVLPDAYALGARLFDEGYINNAILALETEVRRHPMSANAWALMGKAYAENDQDPEAIACLKMANAIDPHNQEVLMLLGISKINEFLGVGACFSFAQWLRLSPYSSLLPQDLEKHITDQANKSQSPSSASSLLRWQGTYANDDAEPDVRVLLTEVFKSAHEANPRDTDVLVILGALHTALDLFSLAIGYFETALAVDASDYTLWNKLGATRANSMAPGRALEAYTHALEKRPNYVRCLANVGISHMAAQKDRNALHFWARALMLNPKATHIWSYMHQSAVRLGLALKEDDEHTLSRLLLPQEPPITLPDSDNDNDNDIGDLPLDLMLGRSQMSEADLQAWSDIVNEWDDQMSRVEQAQEEEAAPTEEVAPKKYTMEELMELIAQGKTPDDVRQIDDKPPNPDAPVAKGDRQRPLKPWERASAPAYESPYSVVLSASGTPTTVHHAQPEANASSSSSTTPMTTAISSTPQPSSSSSSSTSSSSSASSAAAATSQAPPKRATNAGLSIYTVDSFTQEAFAGNPAAVCLVPPTVELSETTMKRIAREMNLSETAFVQPIPGVTNSFKLRWFTPTTEVHLCGHATLATAHVLFTEVGATAPSFSFATLSGELVVAKADPAPGEAATKSSPLLRMDFPRGKPEFTRLPEDILAALLRAMGLAERDLVWREPASSESEAAEPRAPVILVCAVTKKLFVEIVSVSKLGELKPDADALMAIPFEAAGLPVRGVCVMVHGGREDRGFRSGLNVEFYADTSAVPEHVPHDFVTRYFAPWNGIYEDPVNGSSHTALAVYWSQQLGRERLRSFQASARTGQLEVALAPNDRTYIFGHAVTVMGGRLRV